MSRKRDRDPAQLELPLFQPRPHAPQSARPGLRVIEGGGERVHERLASRDAVVRVLLEAGADLLLRRISPERAGEIERRVERVLALFDAVDRSAERVPELEREIEELEAMMRQTRDMHASRRRAP